MVKNVKGRSKIISSLIKKNINGAASKNMQDKRKVSPNIITFKLATIKDFKHF